MKSAPDVIGRYVVRERLGQGGMGVLYLALDPAIDRLVAVKLLGVQGPELRERFVREAGLAGRLQHPNIVTVFDVGAHEGQPFIAMEYIPGETLGEIIQRRATLALRRRLELIVEACQGLAFAHRHGIVHRDVKPANLMVSRDSGALKVLDFGIARGTDSALTQAGMVMGTPNYMSPEQLEGRPLDHRSDIFALGLVLYEMLGYRQAFAGDSPQAVWRQIVHEPPVSILEINPNLDPAILPVIDRAIAKRVEDRYPDLDTMRTELLRIIHRLQSMQAGDTQVDTPLTPPSPARRPDFARLAERRAAQIVGHLRNADAALASQDLEAAQEAAEEAALLDTNDPRVLVLLEKIRHGLDAREVSGLVGEANQAIQSGSLTAAAGLISRALQMMPAHTEALALRATLQQAIETREREQERNRVVNRAIEQAEHQLKAGALESAMRATSEALGYDPAHAAALELKTRVQDSVRQRIDDILRDARGEMVAQRYTAALRLLEQARPRDERVDALETEVRETWAAQTARDAAAAPPVPIVITPPLRTPPQPQPAPAAEEAATAIEGPVIAASSTIAAASIPAPAADSVDFVSDGTGEMTAVLSYPSAPAGKTAAPGAIGEAPPPGVAASSNDPASPGVQPASTRESSLPPAPLPAPPPVAPPPGPQQGPASGATVRPPVSGAVKVATPPGGHADGQAGGDAVRVQTPSAGSRPPTPAPGRRGGAGSGAPGAGSRTLSGVTDPEQRRARAREYLERARAHLAVNDFARALSLVDAAMAFDPSRADAHDLRRHIDQAWAANELGRPSRSRVGGV